MTAPLVTDSHAHVFWDTFDEDRAEMFARARAAGVRRMVVVGTDVETSRACFALAASEEGVYPTAGIHPHDASGSTAENRAHVAELCRREDCVAVGETGLDFFKEYSPRADQLANFDWHLALARELAKPVVIHSRDAHSETVRAVRAHPGVRGVMHCYTMGPDELPPYLEAGLSISFSGVVTFPRNEDNRRAAAEVPNDRLLVETDCPFLAPQGHRGKRNEPALILRTIETLAEVRGTSTAEVARITTENAARLFGLPAPAARA